MKVTEDRISVLEDAIEKTAHKAGGHDGVTLMGLAVCEIARQLRGMMQIVHDASGAAAEAVQHAPLKTKRRKG